MRTTSAVAVSFALIAWVSRLFSSCSRLMRTGEGSSRRGRRRRHASHPVGRTAMMRGGGGRRHGFPPRVFPGGRHPWEDVIGGSIARAPRAGAILGSHEPRADRLRRNTARGALAGRRARGRQHRHQLRGRLREPERDRAGLAGEHGRGALAGAAAGSRSRERVVLRVRQPRGILAAAACPRRAPRPWHHLRMRGGLRGQSQGRARGHPARLGHLRSRQSLGRALAHGSRDRAGGYCARRRLHREHGGPAARGLVLSLWPVRQHARARGRPGSVPVRQRLLRGRPPLLRGERGRPLARHSLRAGHQRHPLLARLAPGGGRLRRLSLRRLRSAVGGGSDPPAHDVSGPALSHCGPTRAGARARALPRACPAPGPRVVRHARGDRPPLARGASSRASLTATAGQGLDSAAGQTARGSPKENDVRKNTVREIWARGETVVNGWLSIPSGFSAEVMAHQGFDSLTVDMQHGVVDYQTGVSMLQGISTTGVIPFARVPWNDPARLMKILDAGAYGVICPMINTREQAEALVQACKYPPRGFRSWGPVRASLYMGTDYGDHANDDVIVMPMIETAEALKNLDDILSVPGVDAIYVGPSDLSLAMGLK